jgi:hypothetical protein
MDLMTSEKLFILTGFPRGGTTYLSAVLHYPPEVISLSEAGGLWKQAYRNHVRKQELLEMMESFYIKVLEGQAVYTVEGTDGYAGLKRVDTWSQRKTTKAYTVESTYKLGLKNPEVFLSWLPLFNSMGIKAVISIRHPVGVINSWTKKGKSRSDKGKSIEGTFANGDSCTYKSSSQSIIFRKIELYNFFVRQILDALSYPNFMVIRYEDWFSDSSLLQRIAEFLNIPCSEKLSPELILPDPVEFLTRTEIDTILNNCTIVEALGYPIKNGKLQDSQL